MKDLSTPGDTRANELAKLGQKVLHMVVNEVEDPEEAEFILSFCRDFVLMKLATKDHGEAWLREEKRTI